MGELPPMEGCVPVAGVLFGWAAQSVCARRGQALVRIRAPP